MTSLAVISDERDAYAWVHEARAKKAGSNVTLSYAEPILMIHASGVKMYDEKGREWLDCVNNVAHVGHGAPSVCSQAHIFLSVNAGFKGAGKRCV
jgi:4-aminobutyrate aminotransferase-like enzyme